MRDQTIASLRWPPTTMWFFRRPVRRKPLNTNAMASAMSSDGAIEKQLTPPKTDAERLCTISALRTICDRLMSEGVVSCFALAPVDDIALATAFVYNGFRRTGLLQNHLVVGSDRKDAIIFSRKLANPADE